MLLDPSANELYVSFGAKALRDGSTGALLRELDAILHGYGLQRRTHRIDGVTGVVALSYVAVPKEEHDG